MHRYLIQVNKPHIDAISFEAALKDALASKAIVLQETEIPHPAILKCSVTPTPNASGVYSAAARFTTPKGDVEVIATADAPSADRALRALGYQNPSAHTCAIYRRRFGNLFELVLDK